MRKKTADFSKEILKMRNDGATYEAISKWLASEKGFVVSPAAVRAFVVKQETIKVAKK
ncbi:hypothetical protein [Arsenophonus nasoniae]|uniref:Uncharacterized protein n=1 Tax=Arsenophonus nasoniae TaxID=638 RepID=A0AA95GFR1_9GAMM|nr:hypothetical protein [Arsenophonus nasoniae]WGL93866.1 hypothetical protein QE207_00880 [Arsenophonus nasoniae]